MIEVDRIVRQSFLLTNPGSQVTNYDDNLSDSFSGEVLKILKNFMILVTYGVLVHDANADDFEIV
jgi:hypothetical protein